MRLDRVVILVCAAVGALSAQSDRDFSGLWKLNLSRSEIHDMPAPPDPLLRVEQNEAVLTLRSSSQEAGPSRTSAYPLDGGAEKRKAGDSQTSTATKWEGSALLVNTIVSGPQSYTVMERWRRSRDGGTLTIKRTIVRSSGESESTLVYENGQGSPVSPAPRPALQPALRPAAGARPAPSAIAAAPQAPEEYIVTAGTRVLLRLTNSVNTKHTAAGDRVYLETAVPVFVNGKLVIPAGAYVAGTVVEAKRAGRVKGKSALNLQFDSLTLRNGVARDLRSRPGSVDAKGSLDRTEGRIQGEGNKGGDARTVAKTTAAGTGIGAIAGSTAGHAGMGAGIGAAAGAAAGLAGVFGSHGPDVVLPAGATMEMVVNRDLRFTADELRTRVQ